MQDLAVNEVYSALYILWCIVDRYHRSKVLVLGEPVKKTTAAAAAASS